MASPPQSHDAQHLRQALEECEARRQSLLDSALDCIICADQLLRITDFNPAAERGFRMARSSAMGKDLASAIFSEELARRHRHKLFVSHSGEGVDLLGNRLETRCQRSDGTEFPAEITVTGTLIDNKAAFIVYVRDITARRRADQAVVWLAAIVESSQDAIIGEDLNGVITSWNKSAQAMYGYTPAEVIGKSVSIIIPPERSHELSRILGDLKAGHRTHNFETVRIAKDGTPLDVSLSVSPVRDIDGTMIGASAIARDITEQKIIARALQKANEASIYVSPIPVIACDNNDRVTMWNPAAESVFGWNEAEVIGKPNPIIPEEDAVRTAALHQILLTGGTLTGVEVPRCKRDGSMVTISLSAAPLWDAKHRVRGIIGFLNDITERKRSEERLRAAEENYRSIFENAVEGIYQATPRGGYISANPALARMLGFDSPDQLVNAHSELRNQLFADSSLRNKFLRLMEDHGAVKNFEYQALRRDGKPIWISENAHAVFDRDGRALYFEGTVQDVTGERELEHQLRQMQRIEAIGRLAGGVAHDFNNILMAISSYAELLTGRMAPTDSNRRYVSEIEKAMHRGAGLTKSLLAFSRKQMLSPRVVNLNLLIAQQIDMLKRLIGDHIELRFTPTPGLGQVKVDPNQVEQVVMNLVINARDAMANGGEVSIRLENGKFEGEAAENTGNYVVLTVADNGCGMNAEIKSHIFEPFFTTKEQGKGTGLGLATVFGIVKQSGGHIEVETQPEMGTTFRIYLPQTEDAVQVTPEARTFSATGKETILLVEDEESVRESTAEYLAQNGYRVLIAEQGHEALEMAKAYEQTIHLLVTDLVMPQMSGKELSQRIARIHAETKVIFISGYSRNLLSDQQVLDPKYLLVQKPFRLEDLGQSIRRVLDGGQVTQQAARQAKA